MGEEDSEFWAPPGWERDDTEGCSRNDSETPKITPTVDVFKGHHCPICLGRVDESSAMVKECGHVFCKVCLFKWLELSRHCPLCKVEVQVLLYNIRSQRDYKVFRRTTGSRQYHHTTSGSAASSLFDGRDFRAMVFRRGLRAQPPFPKARHPKSLEQMKKWVSRDVHAAAPRTLRVSTQLVADMIMALLQENDIEDQEGYCLIKRQGFLFENTDAFLHELWCFKWSCLGMLAYDRDALYNADQT